jgi:hypothetical protein
VTIRVHREYQKVEQRLLLGGVKNGNVQVHQNMMQQPGGNDNATGSLISPFKSADPPCHFAIA